MHGATNRVADFLSRVPGARPSAGVATNDAADGDDDWSVLSVDVFGQTITRDQLQQASSADATIQSVVEHVKRGWPGAAQLSPAVCPYFQLRDELSIEGDGLGCLWREQRLVIPEALQGAVLALAQDGHLGIVKTKQRCRDFVWWPGMERQIEQVVRSCESCARSGKASKPHAAPVVVRPWPSAPWQSLQIDLFGEIHDAPMHFRFMLVVHDLHSKWPEVIPGHRFRSSDVVTALQDRSLWSSGGNYHRWIMARNFVRLNLKLTFGRAGSVMLPRHCTTRKPMAGWSVLIKC